MERSQLLKSLASNPDVKRLAEAIAKRKSDVVVDGLQGSSAALYFAAILSKMANGEGLKAKDDNENAQKDVFLFVMDDQEDAGYFYHDLTQMLGDTHIVFFPSSYRRAIKYNQKDDANELLRTNTLTKIISGSSKLEMAKSEGQKANDNFQLSTLNSQLVIVSYPDALAERVVSRQNVEQHSIVLTKGCIIDVTDLEAQLFDLGFTRTDYVYEPGQFAIRGSIVDVFSFSNEDPYRVDFFGDEVDSIRTFDIVSQLSGEKQDSITIVPDLLETQCQYISLLSFLP